MEKEYNRELAKQRIYIEHIKISNSRKNFHFQTSHALCDQADMIFVEDIDFRISAQEFLEKPRGCLFIRPATPSTCFGAGRSHYK